MLVCKYGRRNEHCSLLAVHDALEHSARRYFRFSESYISAQESVHRPRHLHVALYLIYTAQLVGCFLVREHIFKLSLPRSIRTERIPFLHRPLRGQPYELFRHICDSGLCSRLRLFPVAAAQLVYLRSSAARAYIRLDKVHLLYRHIQYILSCILYSHVVLAYAFYDKRFYADKPSYTVILMNDIIALFQVRKGFYLLSVRTLFLAAALFACLKYIII